MGLTIHYAIDVPKKWSDKTIRAKLESLRQFCLDLPVEEVGEIHIFKGKECEYGDDDDPFRWAKIQAARSLKSPWQPGTHFHQQPSQMLVFSVWPAHGCEQMNVGVCSFRQFVCPKRKPIKEIRAFADARLDKPAWSLAITDAKCYPASARVLKEFARRWKLRRMPVSKNYPSSCGHIARDNSYRVCVCYGRYQSHRRGYTAPWVLVELEDRMQGYLRWRFTGTVEEAKQLFASPEFKADIDRLIWGQKHVVPGEKGTWGSFCKTQYANDPRAGGMPNFLRAHLSVCSILEKAQALGFQVHVHDEGHFWDKRDVKALAEEVGQWDQMIAGLFGMMKDTMPDGLSADSSIAGRPDFERLETKAQAGEIGKLLEKMRACLPKKGDVTEAVQQ